MRILLHSNAPWAPTGYGTQCALIAKSLRNLGHDVAISAFYGLAGNVIEWEGFTVYPCGLHEFGDDIVDSHAKHWRADCFITLQDTWTLPLDLGHRGIPWVALVPVDSDPLAQSVATPLRASCFQVVAYSKFGRDKLSEAGIQADYIPHGIDMTIYYPDPTPKGELKERLGFPSDSFLVGMVAANKGWPSRKSFEECFTAFAQFAKEYPDAQFYAHSMAPPVYKGPDLNDLGAAYGISDRLRFANPYFLLAGLDAGEMRKNYSAFDVLLNPSYGEGFGIPIVEAQACGVPVIVTDYSSMPELCGGGWLVQPARKHWTPLNNFNMEPSIPGILEALREAYRHRGNEKIRADALHLAQRYDQRIIETEFWKPFLERLEDRLMGPAKGGIAAAREQARTT